MSKTMRFERCCDQSTVSHLNIFATNSCDKTRPRREEGRGGEKPRDKTAERVTNLKAGGTHMREAAKMPQIRSVR